VNVASDFLRTLGSEGWSSHQLDTFISLLASLPEAAARHESFAYLLRIAPLSPEQVVFLAKSSPVQSDLALQLSLKRYVRAKEFASSHAAEQSRLASPWAIPLEVLRAVTGLPPIKRSGRGAP
jgi:hypothetical protein